ncbi:MAG: adenylate/guanylate cyclase domain-containing protein [Nitrososphaerales archaeon]
MELERKLAAIMFVDLVGYTKLSQKNESTAIQLLYEEREILRAAFARYGGKEIKTIGDGFLVEFASALDAVRCAVAIQSSVRQRNVSSETGESIQVRIGIHAGDVIHSEDDILGDAVNVASRIEPIAEPGGICISDIVQNHLRNKIENPMISLGRMQLKNLEQPMEVFKVVVTPWQKGSETAVVTTKVELDERRIAVLPMTNMSEESYEYFADGITEEIISTISTISGLHVISRTSVMKYKNTIKGIPEIGKELNVGSILEGSVRKAGNQVRITVQLINVLKDEHLWSQSYDRDFVDIFGIQSDIAKQVSEVLKVKLPQFEKQLIEKTPTTDRDAHNLYLKGRYLWHKGTEQELRAAIECFEEAIKIDPEYALAYVGMADCYIGLCGEGCLDARGAHSKIDPLVRKALLLDENLPEAHATMALLKQDYEWKWEEAEKGFRRAIELNPNWSDVCHSYAVHLALRGRFEQAIKEIKRAEELDPYSIGIHNCAAATYRDSGHLELAIQECKTILEIDPNFVPAIRKLGLVHMEQSKFEEGLEEMERCVEISHGSARDKSYLAYAFGSAGRTDDARAIISDLEQSSTKQYVSPFNLAIAYSGLKDKDMTIKWLQKAFEERASTMNIIKIDHAFDFVRYDSRFVDIQRKMGLLDS